MTQIGLLREGKVPPDFRVPLTPQQALAAQEKFGVSALVQPSPNRCFPDKAYADLGVTLQEDLSACDLLLGVKEVPIANLIPNKTYAFFSHTIKEQAHNQKLMQALLAKSITMIDYEMLVAPNGQRLTAFGREAGIVGAYNALLSYGKKTGTFQLPPVHTLQGVKHLEQVVSELPKIKARVMTTGHGGRVNSGIVLVLKKAGFRQVSAQRYLSEHEQGVFVSLDVQDYMERSDGRPLVAEDFFDNPKSDYQSCFLKYAQTSDVYISGHYWDSLSPVFFEMSDIANPHTFPISVISDISCDLPGPIPTTLRESTSENIAYDIDRQTGKELPAFSKNENITITAVDNLPSCIPCDASTFFGESLLTQMLPFYLGEDDGRIANATLCSNGQLTTPYLYLKKYAGVI